MAMTREKMVTDRDFRRCGHLMFDTNGTGAVKRSGRRNFRREYKHLLRKVMVGSVDPDEMVPPIKTFEVTGYHW
jgi:hypothetical protein